MLAHVVLLSCRYLHPFPYRGRRRLDHCVWIRSLHPACGRWRSPQGQGCPVCFLHSACPQSWRVLLDSQRVGRRSIGSNRLSNNPIPGIGPTARCPSCQDRDVKREVRQNESK
jgi:hypothetical protein